MNADDAEGEVLVGHLIESRLLDHPLELLLLGEPADALHQVLVRLPLASQQLAHRRDHLEGVLVVQPLHRLVGQVAELQAHEASARLQHSIRLGKNLKRVIIRSVLNSS